MHVMEVALFASLMRQQRAHDEPMPDQWPRPRRSRAATAALAAISAVGLVVVIVGVAVAAPTPIMATAGVEAMQR